MVKVVVPVGWLDHDGELLMMAHMTRQEMLMMVHMARQESPVRNCWAKHCSPPSSHAILNFCILFKLLFSNCFNFLGQNKAEAHLFVPTLKYYQSFICLSLEKPKWFGLVSLTEKCGNPKRGGKGVRKGSRGAHFQRETHSPTTTWGAL